GPRRAGPPRPPRARAASSSTARSTSAPPPTGLVALIVLPADGSRKRSALWAGACRALLPHNSRATRAGRIGRQVAGGRGDGHARAARRPEAARAGAGEEHLHPLRAGLEQ